jgi:hypothetical protein
MHNRASHCPPGAEQAKRDSAINVTRVKLLILAVENPKTAELEPILGKVTESGVESTVQECGIANASPCMGVREKPNTISRNSNSLMEPNLQPLYRNIFTENQQLRPVVWFNNMHCSHHPRCSGRGEARTTQSDGAGNFFASEL